MFNSIVLVMGDILEYFHSFTHNYGYAIILFALLIKMLLSPLTVMQIRSMKKLQEIKPELDKLQKKYKSEPEVLNKKLFELYKQHNINPLGGCFPLLIQLPILWALFKTIVKHSQAGKFLGDPPFLWIGSALANKLHNLDFTLAGHKISMPLIGRSLAEPDLILLVFYGFSMYLSQLLSTPATSSSPQQKSMGIMMAVFFPIILASYPSALVLYWLVYNIFSIVHQEYIMRVLLPREEKLKKTLKEV